MAVVWKWMILNNIIFFCWRNCVFLPPGYKFGNVCSTAWYLFRNLQLKRVLLSFLYYVLRSNNCNSFWYLLAGKKTSSVRPAMYLILSKLPRPMACKTLSLLWKNTTSISLRYCFETNLCKHLWYFLEK